ncbi:MAG: DNA primase [Myxococcales bacterium]|nr:DNA primase [Myxococcales bacterium]
MAPRKPAVPSLVTHWRNYSHGFDSLRGLAHTSARAPGRPFPLDNPGALPRIQPLDYPGQIALGLIPEEKITEIRDRTDIVQVIGEYVALRKSGINHKGLCPFHGEKTPSFNVNSAKQIFHCFGCGKSGDVFRFVMEHDGKPFLDVVRELARRGAIDLPEPERTPEAREAQKRNETDRARLLRVLQLGCEYFRGELASARGERGRAYIVKRGIGPSVEEAFLLGYAPPGWDGLVRFLEAKKVPADLAERVGLIRARDGAKLAPGSPPTKATHFDMFRDRVIFPLINPQAEVIAFGGRTLETDPAVPKYINSPESGIYRKGENLFGLHAAKGAIRKAGRAILVEGNFDVLAMHEHGFTETVAPMGTALTKEQVHLLHRYSPARVNLFLDGDSAGFAAAARDVGIFLDEELLSYVTTLPLGEDPDTFLAKFGKDGVKLLLDKSKESVEYFCAYAWKRTGDSIVERVKLLEDEAAPLIRKVKNETARRRYAEKLALELDLPLDTVGKVIRGGRNTGPDRRPEVAPLAAAPMAGAPQKLSPGDRELIKLIADHPRLLQRLVALGVLRCITNPELRRAFTDLCDRTTTFKFDAAAFAATLDPPLRPQIMEAALSGHYAHEADPEKTLLAIIRKFEKDGLLVELKRALTEARAGGDPSEIQKLNARINELNQQRLGLKG